jgi:CheY-like chemotaxis protein
LFTVRLSTTVVQIAANRQRAVVHEESVMAGSREPRDDGLMAERGGNRLRVVGEDGVVAPRRAIAVLYVEDDREDVYLVRRHLRSLPSFDVQFSHAATVADARAMTAGRRFDVVLCDFWLGHETTISLIDDMKASRAPSPIVLVSSLDNEDIELIGRRAGAAGFVAKADLSAATLDRVFSTLLRTDEDEDEIEDDDRLAEKPSAGGAAGWLRALMRGIDAIQAAGSGRRSAGGHPAAFGTLVDELGPAAAGLRDDLHRTLVNLKRATPADRSELSRFDAIPQIADAVAKADAQRGGGVDFVQPVTAVMIDASPALFPDLLQGFLAEAVEAPDRDVSVEPSIRDGRLVVEIVGSPFVRRSGPADGADRGPARSRAEAAAVARRLVVESMAANLGGRFLVVDQRRPGTGLVARLELPLRPSA